MSMRSARSWALDCVRAMAAELLRTGWMSRSFREEEVLDLVGGDRDAACTIVDLFLGDYPARVIDLKGAVGCGDARRLREAAHSLKGAAANLMAPEVVDLTARMESLALTGDLSTAPLVLESLIATITLLAEDLRDWKSRLAETN